MHIFSKMLPYLTACTKATLVVIFAANPSLIVVLKSDHWASFLNKNWLAFTKSSVLAWNVLFQFFNVEKKPWKIHSMLVIGLYTSGSIEDQVIPWRLVILEFNWYICTFFYLQWINSACWCHFRLWNYNSWWHWDQETKNCQTNGQPVR